jgi:NADPH:quinone reductase-like Zn-dependent oxidoreductase
LNTQPEVVFDEVPLHPFLSLPEDHTAGYLITTYPTDTKDSKEYLMKAVRIHCYGDPSVLQYEEAPPPTSHPDDVVITVVAAGVNPIDWKIRQGHLKDMIPYTFPLILGMDVAGTVERVGDKVTQFRFGDAVYAKTKILRLGAYAENAAVDVELVALAPTSIPLFQAAGIPLAATTAWTALFDDARIKPGQTILIHAASGGVGMFAVQLAKHWKCRVIATTSAAHADMVKSLGADEVIDYRSEDFSARVKDADVVLDAIGGETQAKSFKVLRKGGILLSLVEPVDEELAKQYGVTGKAVLGKSDGARLRKIAELVDTGVLKVIIGTELPLSEARTAHELSESGHATGKIILRVA